MSGAAPLPQATFVPDQASPAGGHLLLWGAETTPAGFPPGEPAVLPTALPHGTEMAKADVAAVSVPLDQALPVLARLPHHPPPSDSLLAWHLAAVRSLAEAVSPPEEPGGAAWWEELAAAMPPAAHALRVDEEHIWPARRLLASFRDAVAQLPTAVLSGHRRTREFGPVEVVPGAVQVVERLRHAGRGAAPDLSGIHATLRGYQIHGIAWLRALAEVGVGALLADEMGLGKTVQAIGLLAGRRDHGPHLVVCPTSLVGNWHREITRFAPATTVVRHHGPNRDADLGHVAPGTVVVTSYGVLRADRKLLGGLRWDVVVLDEAQQVKNHAAQAARDARSLTATARVALTGTPIENRLTELWSVMSFLNPGLLGTPSRFKDEFVAPIERGGQLESARRLREITAPFLLRRTKSEVATELPDKNESIVACTLTREQEVLYRNAATAALDHGLGSGMARRGRILKLLTALKQICNHPAQYLREPGPLSGRSGKLDRTTEMLSEMTESGERALVFTQYRVMGELLAEHLSTELGTGEIPFLHGGLPLARREDLVARFQEEGDGAQVLILSLRAAGFGLNLTRARHVVHYDRWWNPAVEDQATDRAHRIGQHSRVNVYKLVTGGTVEERIADMLVRKRGLAEAVVGTGKDWLTELDDADLRTLIGLGGVGGVG